MFGSLLNVVTVQTLFGIRYNSTELLVFNQILFKESSDNIVLLAIVLVFGGTTYHNNIPITPVQVTN